MIGAMPAVAVRHERRRAEKRGRRPSQLPLQLGRGVEDATPSPEHRLRNELYVCGKVRQQLNQLIIFYRVDRNLFKV